MVSIHEIWNEFLEFGYSEGEDIPYCILEDVCDVLNIYPSDAIIDKLSEQYGVNIG